MPPALVDVNERGNERLLLIGVEMADLTTCLGSAEWLFVFRLRRETSSSCCLRLSVGVVVDSPCLGQDA